MSGIPGLIRALLPPAAPTGAQGPAPLEAAQLRALLDIGDVLTVRVLGQVAGRSTLEIAGRPVMAALPEGVAPGDLLQVRVEGFTPDQVLLKLLAQVTVSTPAAGEPAPVPELASVPTPSGPPMATPQPNGPIEEPPATTPQPPAAAPPPPATSPPPPSDQTTMSPSPLPASRGEAAVETADDLRARLAAFRLSTAAGALPPTRRALPPQPFTSPPPPASPPARSAQIPTSQTSPAQTPASQARPPLAPAPPGVTMLRALRVPVTPTTLAAARIALRGATGQVAETLTALQRALPGGSADPRVQQVRAIAEFVGVLDPARPEVLPARLQAYVEHVLSRESRLQEALAPRPDAATGQQAIPQPPPEVGTARLVVAREALAVNLKTQLLALLADNGEGSSVHAALQSALTAITATQLQTLSLQAGNASALMIPLPLSFPAGGQQAYLRVERDGRGSAERISAESFHVALILETKHYGTVAIELLCADRALSVGVKTERPDAAATFERQLPALGARLERLSYRVVRLGAEVAPVSAAPAARPAAVPTKSRDGSALDLHA